jgi:hypothetical protein
MMEATTGFEPVNRGFAALSPGQSQRHLRTRRTIYDHLGPPTHTECNARIAVR